MVFNRIHLGPVIFAKTLAASIAVRQAAPLSTEKTQPTQHTRHGKPMHQDREQRYSEEIGRAHV